MHLDRARWSRIELLFEQAQGLPAADRTAFLQQACGPDAALCAEVQAMLAMAEDDHALSIERLVGKASSSRDGPSTFLISHIGPAV